MSLCSLIPFLTVYIGMFISSFFMKHSYTRPLMYFLINVALRTNAYDK